MGQRLTGIPTLNPRFVSSARLRRSNDTNSPSQSRAVPWALRALADRLVRLCAGVGEDLEDDPMMNEMFRAESANDMRRLTVSAFVAFAICPALPRCRNVRMAEWPRPLWLCARPFHTCTVVGVGRGCTVRPPRRSIVDGVVGTGRWLARGETGCCRRRHSMLTTCRNLCHIAAGFASHRNRQVSELAGKQSDVASHVSLNGALHASIRTVTPRAPHQPRATLMAAMRAVQPLWYYVAQLPVWDRHAKAA